MARKKSVGGRSRTTNTLYYNLERTNRKLRKLQRANLAGKYASKTLIQSLRGTAGVKIGRRKAKNIIAVNRQLSHNQKLYINKRLKQFVESETSTPTGIKRKRAETKENVLKGLSKLVDRELDDEDLDDFYDLVESDEFSYFADKIGSSEAYTLLDDAKQNSFGEKEFRSQLKTKMTLNSKEARDKATRLYNKYVKE